MANNIFINLQQTVGQETNVPTQLVTKLEYLIEEYMGLGPNETINWDPTPTWGV